MLLVWKRLYIEGLSPLTCKLYLCYNKRRSILVIVAKDKSDWMEDILGAVKRHITDGSYKFSDHALEELVNDNLDLPDIIHVLLHGRHDESKTTFSTKHQSWNYAISGKTIDGLDVRVIVAFDDIMMVVTVFICGTLKRKKRKK